MTEIVEQIEVPSAKLREEIGNGPIHDNAFRPAMAALPCLREVELIKPPSRPVRPLADARVVFWNAERLKYLTPSVALLNEAKSDICLLCELDLGMARSGNIHTTAELAGGLGAGYAFAVEFVELGLGDARERKWHETEVNSAGMHGAGIVSRQQLHRPKLIRLETTGRWFDGQFGERRVGGRIALMAEVEIGGQPVLVVSVHYESHTDPDDRLASTGILLDAIDQVGADLPVLIGGDFNTNTFSRADHKNKALVAQALKDDPDRYVCPMPYEPMFATLQSRGYEWETCNVMGAATQRTRPDGSPIPPFGRIDWFFARGLVCSDPVQIPAVDSVGSAISDHDAMAVTIRPAGR